MTTRRTSNEPQLRKDRKTIERSEPEEAFFSEVKVCENN